MVTKFLILSRNRIGAKSMTSSTGFHGSPCSTLKNSKAKSATSLSTRHGSVIRAVPLGNDHPFRADARFTSSTGVVISRQTLRLKLVIREYRRSRRKRSKRSVLELAEAARCEAMVAGVHAMVNEVRSLCGEFSRGNWQSLLLAGPQQGSTSLDDIRKLPNCTLRDAQKGISIQVDVSA